MGKIYLNDIDIDIFAKYFNSKNYSNEENTLLYEEVTIPGKKYKYPSVYVEEGQYNNDIITDKSKVIDLYYVDRLGSETGYEITKFDTSKIYMLSIINGIRVVGSTDTFSKSVTIPKSEITVGSLIDIIEFDYRVYRIHGDLANEDFDVFGNKESLYYTITMTITDDTVTFVLSDPVIGRNLWDVFVEVPGSNEPYIRYLFDQETTEIISEGSNIDVRKIHADVKDTTLFGNNPSYLFGKFKDDTSGIIYNRYSKFNIAIYPYVYNLPSTNNDGEYLYSDRNGKRTVLPEYNNNFFRHQKAMRKAFFGLVENTGWQYKVAPKEIVVLQKGENHQFAFYYNQDKVTKYETMSAEEFNTLADADENIVANTNIPSKQICQIVETEGSYTTRESTKITEMMDIIENYPRFMTYIKNGDDITSEGFKFNYIKGLNNRSIKEYAGKPCILDCYSRTIKIGNDVYDISTDETVKLRSTIMSSKTSGSLSNDVPECEFTINNITSPNPYILVPIITDKKEIITAPSNIMNLGGHFIRLGNLIGEIKVDGNNVTDVKLSINNTESPVYTAEEVGYDNDDILIGLGGNVETDDIYFFKIQLPEVNKILEHTVLCTLDENILYAPEKIKNVKIVETAVIKQTDKMLVQSNPIINKPIITPNKSIVKEILPISSVIIENEPVKKVTTTSGVSAGITGTKLLNTRTASCQFSMVSMMSLRRDATNSEREIVSIEYTPKETQLIEYPIIGTEVSDVIYYENPYTTDPSKMYIKKTISDVITDDVSSLELDKYVFLYTVRKMNSNASNIVDYFTGKGKYFRDEMVALRGDLVPEDVFYDKRVTAIRDSLKDLLNSKNAMINPITEFFKANGQDRIYNYCKGIVNLIKEDFRVEPSEVIGSKTLINLKKYIKETVLERTSYNKPDKSSSIPLIRSSLSYDRPFFVRLSESDSFPIRNIYENYNRIINEARNVISRYSTTTRDNNMNLKMYNKNKINNKYVDSSNEYRYLMARGIGDFMISRAPKFLDIGISPSIIKDPYFEVTPYDATYKKVYVPSEMDESDLIDLITDLTIPSEGKIMEVMNGRK